MIDIHSHIIAGVDDGADSIEGALEMLEMASKDGVEAMIATPHFHRGYYENEYADVVRHVQQLNEKAAEKQISVQVYPGQEVCLHSKTIKDYKEKRIQGIHNTQYLLIELSGNSLEREVLDTIYELRLLGITPIVAHVERYGFIIEKPSRVNSLLEEGCLIQINAGSIDGTFTGKLQKTAETLLRHGVCHFIASDAHSTTRRKPGMRKAMEAVKEINAGLFESIMSNPRLLLENCLIMQRVEKMTDKKRLFAFFRDR